jgi:hypothetical protein
MGTRTGSRKPPLGCGPARRRIAQLKTELAVRCRATELLKEPCPSSKLDEADELLTILSERARRS